MVIYDNEKQRIGWKPEDCNTLLSLNHFIWAKQKQKVKAKMASAIKLQLMHYFCLAESSFFCFLAKRQKMCNGHIVIMNKDYIHVYFPVIIFVTKRYLEVVYCYYIEFKLKFCLKCKFLGTILHFPSPCYANIFFFIYYWIIWQRKAQARKQHLTKRT